MAKRLFLLLCISLFGNIAASTSLMATDEVILAGIKTAAYNKELNSDDAPLENEILNDDNSDIDVNSLDDDRLDVENDSLDNFITIAGRTLEVIDVDNTVIDAGGHVNRYKDKFLYGHNSDGVFRILYDVGVGDTFTVSKNGVSINYLILETTLYEKASSTSLSFNGVEYKMKTVANGQGRYDLVLMTCAGESYGDGDASHRLVIYANAV